MHQVTSRPTTQPSTEILQTSSNDQTSSKSYSTGLSPQTFPSTSTTLQTITSHVITEAPSSVSGPSTTGQKSSTIPSVTSVPTTNEVTTTASCSDDVYGLNCTYGINNTQPNIDTGRLPTRKVNITLVINTTFISDYLNLNSPKSISFINILLSQLEPLCRKADPYTFKSIQVFKLVSGSVIAETEAQYSYVNSDSKIQYVNNQLEEVLKLILNDTTNLYNIGKAFNSTAPTQLQAVTFESPPVRSITQLEPYISCTYFANYTPEVINGSWECVGPCKTTPYYCNHHGDCYNQIYLGPICFCYSSSIRHYYGPRCELSSWGPGFYGALFGSLAGAFLLLCMFIIAAAVYRRLRRSGSWTRRDSFDRRLSTFEEDFFDYRGHHNLRFSRI
ncbi:mucin-3B [Boleophthalmus pectinirostris]|uniref:mucin-3B n=1 Tax=Boleophthalmus pectinirostris TaxID=150288 RepID=UPI00242B4164|nr:mucin-3B [Boleophthalmus pectinirostris]